MKYIGTVVLALLVSVAMGQKSNLKGPAAKNYKVWKDTSLTGTNVNLASASDKYEEGANAKNTHAITESVEMTVVPNTNAKRAKGANAKNRRAVALRRTIEKPVAAPAKQEQNESGDSIIQRK